MRCIFSSGFRECSLKLIEFERAFDEFGASDTHGLSITNLDLAVPSIVSSFLQSMDLPGLTLCMIGGNSATGMWFRPGGESFAPISIFSSIFSYFIFKLHASCSKCGDFHRWI